MRHLTRVVPWLDYRAKWNAPKDPTKPDVCLEFAKKASAAELADFARVAAKLDPRGMFQTTWLKKLFDLH